MRTPLFVSFLFALCLAHNIYVNPLKGTNSAKCEEFNDACPSLSRAFSVISNFTSTKFDIFITGDLKENVTSVLSEKYALNKTINVVPYNISSVTISSSVPVAFDFSTNAVFTFKNIRFMDSQTVLRLKSAATFSQCEFRKNKIAIETTGDLTLEDVTFAENDGEGSTVSVVANSTTLMRVVFDRNNNKNDGGVLSLNGGNFRIHDSNFTSNSASNSTSGAVHVTGAFGEIRNSNFTENSAKSAAAVGLYNDANVLVISSTFLKNKAAEQGGAFVISGATTTINQTSFQENSAANGGVAVISGTKGQTFFGQCNFTRNSATQKGSDLYMDYNTNIQMDKVVTTHSDGPTFCTDAPAGNTTTNIYCKASCRAPQCSLCPGLCLLDNSDAVTYKGAGNCYSALQQGCEHGVCRLYLAEDKVTSKSQCECDATWGSDNCDSRSWLFYVLLFLSGVALFVAIGGGVFTCQNRLRNRRAYATLN